MTPLLATVSGKCDGTMYGLDFRIKSMASLARKVLEKSGGVADKVEGTLNKQNDALRYTILFPTDVYVNGVKEVEKALTEQNIGIEKMKNFWRKPGESTDYMGINAIYRTEDGFPFEVQYHTLESIDTKMQRCHHSYEKFREDHSMAKAQYWVRRELPVLRPCATNSVCCLLLRTPAIRRGGESLTRALHRRRRWCGCGRSYPSRRVS